MTGFEIELVPTDENEFAVHVGDNITLDHLVPTLIAARALMRASEDAIESATVRHFVPDPEIAGGLIADHTWTFRYDEDVHLICIETDEAQATTTWVDTDSMLAHLEAVSV